MSNYVVKSNFCPQYVVMCFFWKITSFVYKEIYAYYGELFILIIWLNDGLIDNAKVVAEAVAVEVELQSQVNNPMIEYLNLRRFASQIERRRK